MDRKTLLLLMSFFTLNCGSNLAVDRRASFLQPCDSTGRGALCASLTVPEDPRDQAGRTIVIHVVVIPALHSKSETVPLFHLEGGPGIAATSAAEFYLGSGTRFRQNRDVVLIDQRGTGESSALRCPELEARSPLQNMYPPSQVAACRSALESRADLTKYGTSIAASDLDQVRSVLGYQRVDLWALSYGTQLAQEYLKQYPTRVRRAVLVGVAPLDLRSPLYHAANSQRVLDLLFEQCQSDVACRSAYPTLRSDWQAILDRLEAAPVVVVHDATAGGQTEIRRGPFGEAFRGLLETASGQRRIPFIIDRAAKGDFGPFLNTLPPNSSQFAEGLYLSVVCSEGTSRIDSSRIDSLTAGTFLGDYRVRQQVRACEEWPISIVNPDFFVSAASSIPVLILSGEMDAVTPPGFARQVCAGLQNCRLVSIPALAHGVFDLEEWSGGSCFDQLALEFYESLNPAQLDTSCVNQMAPPAFFVRSDEPK